MKYLVLAIAAFSVSGCSNDSEMEDRLVSLEQNTGRLTNENGSLKDEIRLLKQRDEQLERMIIARKR